MKILVSGATSYIGNHVVCELLKHGHQVVATSKNFEKARVFKWFSQVEYIPYDLNIVQDNLFHFFREPDVVIHLAWEGLSDYRNLIHFERNLYASYRFLKTLLDGGLKSLTVTGSCLEYGLQNGCLSEDTPAQPVISYGIAKDTLRKILEIKQQKSTFSFKWLRLFYIYGKGHRNGSLLSQLDIAVQAEARSFSLSGGEQLRDYLDIEMAAEYIVRLAMQNKVGGIINCCSGSPISIRELVDNYLTAQKIDIRLNWGYYSYTDYEPMAFWGDLQKLKKAI